MYFLHRAYIIAQARLGQETMKWIDGCCKEAVYECNKLGLNKTISARTVAHWNNILSANCGKFPHPNPSIFTRNGRTPLLFEYFPESILDFKKLIFDDYNSFTIERLRHDVISDVIPKYLSKATDIGETSPEYMQLSNYSHQSLSYETICRWVCWMGFEQDSTKNHIMLMVMRNQSRNCIEHSSSKLT